MQSSGGEAVWRAAMKRNTNPVNAQIGPEDPVPLWLAVACTFPR